MLNLEPTKRRRIVTLKTYAAEARCELILANREVHTQLALQEIRQRHDALEHVEDRLCAARTAELALGQYSQFAFDSLKASSAQDRDELVQRAAEEVQSAEAEVAAHEEVLQRYASEAAAKASHESAEYRDAVARANSMTEGRYQIEMRRERDAHRHALEKCSADTEIAVTTRMKLELQARENERHWERKLAGIKFNEMTVASQLQSA